MVYKLVLNAQARRRQPESSEASERNICPGKRKTTMKAPFVLAKLIRDEHVSRFSNWRELMKRLTTLRRQLWGRRTGHWRSTWRTESTIFTPVNPTLLPSFTFSLFLSHYTSPFSKGSFLLLSESVRYSFLSTKSQGVSVRYSFLSTKSQRIR